jgi:hypothetical protein
MLIIDSPLVSSFFSLGEMRENPLSFSGRVKRKQQRHSTTQVTAATARLIRA